MNFDNKIYIRYQKKDYSRAIEDFDKEISNAKNDFERDSFLWDKAQFLYNIGNYKGALKIYNALLVQAQSDRIYLIQNRLYFERSQVYKRMGKEKEAQKDMEQALDLNLDSEFQNPIPVPTLLLDNI